LKTNGPEEWRVFDLDNRVTRNLDEKIDDNINDFRLKKIKHD
jgi:hypothetical protein